jgi:sugar phosphate isomerase/epimerase
VDIERREFLGIIGAGTLAGRIGRLLPVERQLPSIGLQLYSVRDDLRHDFDGTLQKVSAIGYGEVEFAGYSDHTPREVTAALSRSRLSAPSAHFDFQHIENDWPATLEAARAIGHRYIVCSWVNEGRRRSLGDWKHIVEALNRAGAASKSAGIQLAYHSHVYEFAPLDGKLPYDFLLAETDSQLVKFEMDVYWLVKGNQAPLDYFSRYPGRFPMLHVKDMDSRPDRLDPAVGRGIIDFKKIFARADEAGIKHYFVEQENSSTPWEDIRASFDYTKNLRF